MIDDLMTVKDVAERLGVKPETVRQYKLRGDLPEPDGLAGRSPLWRAAAIEAWIASRRGHGWRKDDQPG
ncbi:AlpA family transcriptional regulator [Murinocardiopsis flavida]|uniref:AlpA family transcriptional regulator n=1 Tax=Murinocardiopsis flavida TaxID=645275 RepID=A0A2P8DFP4_9ACTN|nr:helix-turn-helix domain-containing protein [Murinocardiopsis flavida]PSK96041.1 AlpA family transcriptional regulator [Murinocardiopsis flavida]